MPRLRVIPEPAEGTRTVMRTMVTDPDFVFVRGEAPGLTYDCGACGRVLIDAVIPGQVGNLVFECPSCKAFNDTQ